MNSDNSSNDFNGLLRYFGVLVSDGTRVDSKSYHDIEKFILRASLKARSSRQLEGVLCWMRRYARIVSPSKLRKLIKEGHEYDPFVLGGFVDFMQEHQNKKRCFQILYPYLKKRKKPQGLIQGPRIRRPDPLFARRGILVPNFQLEEDKFLLPQERILKDCLELKFRLLFGQVVNADVAAALMKNRSINAYRAAKTTGNHKARVLEVFEDVKAGI